MITVKRYHDISCGHRVVGHEGKCRNLHGHNYRIHFEVMSDIVVDKLGRVLDFSAIKERLCAWLEENWDHKMVLWTEDADFAALYAIDETVTGVPFNPTAENMAKYLVDVVGPVALKGTQCRLISCIVEETRKCSAAYTRIA